ncbi:MAG: hypothetical protein WCA81_17710 [Rhizomicrobium sp.]
MSSDDLPLADDWQLQALLDFIKMIEETSAEVSVLPDVTVEQKNALKKDADRLRELASDLRIIIEDYETLLVHESTLPPQFQCTKLRPGLLHGLVALQSGLSTAFRIGGRVIENPVMKAIQDTKKKKQTASARKARSQPRENAAAVIWELANEYWTRHPKQKSDYARTAQIITPEVNKRLSDRDTPYKEDTIRRYLSEM